MISIGALVVAIAASALGALSALADAALLALNSHDLDPSLASLRDRRERVHRAIAFTRIATHLVVGISIALAFNLARLSLGATLLIALPIALVMAGLTESLARAAGDSLGARAVRPLSGFINVIETVCTPIVSLGFALERWLNTLLPPPQLDDEDRDEAAEQFIHVVAAEAEVSKEQKVLLGGVFALKATTVGEIMVPRVEIVAIDRDSTWAEAVDRVRFSEHSRLPVYADSIDNAIGVVYAKDLLPAVVADQEPEPSWTHLVRPATFIPTAKSADAQLRDFQSSGTHMAIVVDEFGGTAGLVTIEDVLEEIVGEIRDEYDEEEPPIEHVAEGRYKVAARLTLDELSEITGSDFTREGVSTVGGLVYDILGRVPKAGERLTTRGYTVIVERVVRRRVQRVYLEKNP
ncbi:MAG TPA: hemolysin family protein [Gemmatimonadaceae bacterium]|nr:hemolysin family protein [Gemmatimonadaceae bacterium]